MAAREGRLVGVDTFVSTGWQLRRRARSRVEDRSTLLYVVRTYVRAYTYAHTRALVYANVHAHIQCTYLYIYICAYIYVQARTHNIIYIYMRTHVYVSVYKYAHTYEDVWRTHACVGRGPPGGDWLAVDSALPNMGQSRRSIHKTTGRAAARLSSCATPTHRASFNNPRARANTTLETTHT